MGVLSAIEPRLVQVRVAVARRQEKQLGDAVALGQIKCRLEVGVALEHDGHGADIEWLALTVHREEALLHCILEFAAQLRERFAGHVLELVLGGDDLHLDLFKPELVRGLQPRMTVEDDACGGDLERPLQPPLGDVGLDR